MVGNQTKSTSKESLPVGIDRLPSGSLRVRVRVQGMETALRNFPLHQDTKDARARQLLDATEWMASTTARMKSGQHVSTREAEKLTLKHALELFRDEGMTDRSPEARKNATYLINNLIQDPIANRSLSMVSKPDISALRDRLITQGWLKKIDTELSKLSRKAPSSEITNQLDDIQALIPLRKKYDDATGKEKTRLEREFEKRSAASGIKKPSPTSVKNQINKLNMALKFAGERIHGVAEPVRGVSMPTAAPSRIRRPTPDEWNRLLKAAGTINPLCPLILRFAVLTALRRERCLTVRTSNLFDIAPGKQVIRFPKESGGAKKKTGIIPVTSEIRAIIDEALAMRGDPKANDRLIFEVPIETFEVWHEKAQRAAKIHDLHFHDLRHEATSRLFEQGLHMMEVMAVTGHTTTEMVERYAHYDSALILEKMERGPKRSPESILEDIKEMVAQYKEKGGDELPLRKLKINLYS